MTNTVDVLIVGDGIAGCCAAIAAHEQGAHVVVIDKAPQDVPHGNTAFSGGAFRRTGIEYPAEQFLADLMRLSGNRADPEIARTVVERSAGAQIWLESIGVRFPAETRLLGQAPEVEDRGRALASAVRSAVRARGIEVRSLTEATALLQRNDRVVGVQARHSDGRGVTLNAGAVILATGGFSANPDMVVRYIGPGARHLVLRGSPYNTGDGLRMAEAIGAKLDWMDDFHGGLIPYAYKEHREDIEKAGTGMRHIAHYEVAVLINQDGKRFVDEGEYLSDKTYAKFGKIVPLTQPGGVAYVVFDKLTRHIVDPVYTGPGSDPIEAPTLDALANKIGVPADVFCATIKAFNAGVCDGKNLTVTPPKTGFAQTIETPPYYAHKVTGGFTFTFGGLRVDGGGTVLDTAGKPIPGLFAAGEITTGLFYGNYAGGSSLPKCTIFGRITGVAAARFAASVSADSNLQA